MVDPIVTEVRKNREKLLEKFDGDINKLRTHLDEQRPKWEDLGFRYETVAERQSRFAQ